MSLQEFPFELITEILLFAAIKVQPGPPKEIHRNRSLYFANGQLDINELLRHRVVSKTWKNVADSYLFRQLTFRYDANEIIRAYSTTLSDSLSVAAGDSDIEAIDTV